MMTASLAFGLGSLIGLGLGALFHTRDRRHAGRFRDAAAFARYQNETMQAEGSHRPDPDGQHWCDLYDVLQPFEEA